MSQRLIESVASNSALDEIAARTLAQAFQNDPALAWIIQDAEKRRRSLGRFFETMQAQSFRHGRVLASPDREAVSLWYPPGQIQDSWIDATKDNWQMLRVFGTTLSRGLSVADAMYAKHPKPQEHWYLRYVGVSPDEQGKGWGSAIVRAGIAQAAAQNCGVLLETATPENVGLYLRLGFEITAEWNVSGGGPRFWTMVHV